MPPSYEPTTDVEVETFVRHGLTGYTDETDLSSTAFDAVLDIAKLRLERQVDSDKWYEDPGLGQALVFATAILAKSRVENYTVSNYSFGDINLDVTGMAETESLQLQQWAQAVAEGIEDAEATPNSSEGLRNTSSFIGNNR